MIDANEGAEAVVASSVCTMVCLHPDLTWEQADQWCSHGEHAFRKFGGCEHGGVVAEVLLVAITVATTVATAVATAVAVVCSPLPLPLPRVLGAAT
jgi:hypothetical protein